MTISQQQREVIVRRAISDRDAALAGKPMALERIRAAIAADRCDGESDYAAGVNAACRNHLALIDAVISGRGECLIQTEEIDMDQLQFDASIEDVIAERRRQMLDKGYSSEHDDAHSGGELARAAVASILNDRSYWPWGPASFVYKKRRASLVRAAALVLAEIDRIDRRPCMFAEQCSEEGKCVNGCDERAPDLCREPGCDK